MASSRTVALLAIGVAWFAGNPATAWAVDDGCFDAYEQTQRLRNSGKLMEARDQALVCARPECPAALKNDCAKWGEEIGRNLATAIFSAKDETGQVVTACTVYVDDRKVADSIDGVPLTLDPGPHKLRVETGDRKVETIFQLAAGDSNRRVEAVLPPRAAPVVIPVAPPPAHRIPTASLVLAGVAGVGLVSFISFAAAGRVEQGCSPRCAPGQISTLRTEYAVADASWIIGLAALGTGIAYWVLKPAHEPDPAAASTGSLHFEAGPQPGGATFGLVGTF